MAQQLIFSDMSCFRYFKSTCLDIWVKLCNNKWRSVFCALSAIAGIVVGVVLFNVNKYGWWYGNRIVYAEKLFYGGFSLFFIFLLWTVIFYLCLVLCNINPVTRFLNYVLLFLSCFYCGANTAAVIVCWSVWGVLFCIFVTVAEVISCYLVCFVAFCEPALCRTWRETFCDFRQCASILVAAFIVKIVGYFIILRLITAVI